MTCDKCRNTGCDHHKRNAEHGCRLFSGMSFLTCTRCF